MHRPSAALLLGAALLAAFAVAAAAAPLVAPYDPRLPVAAPLTRPSAAHWLGTNDIGQDILSECLWGGRASLANALMVALISSALSWAVGLAAGLSRRAEWPLMGVSDLLLALPSVPLYMLVVALVGPSWWNVALTLGLLSWPAFARIVRARVIGVRAEPYVQAAAALGASPWRRAIRHVLPATLSLLPAKLVLTVRYAIFAESTLAFLGLGDPAAKSWGAMVGWAFAYPMLFAGSAWTWWVLPPAIAIAGVVLATTWMISSVEADRV